MSISEHFIEEIKDRTRLSEVAGRFTRLKKRGRAWTGLSPFTAEKTPSFFVYDEEKYFKCYSSGKSGDAISLIREIEKLSFVEAVEKLAAEAGLVMPIARTAPDPGGRRAATRTVLEAASSWFQDQLSLPHGAPARDYLRSRGIGQDNWTRHGLGCAPPKWTGLIDHFGKESLPALSDAGLIVMPDPDDGKRPYDRFRNRLIFPIRDERGRVIAFGGRALDESQRAKYLNSPETGLFKKGRLLYRYDSARAACAGGEKGPILVEGYMDAIALSDAGIDSAVAPLGTALSHEQLALLWTIGPEPIVCFDGDAAGRRAAGEIARMAVTHVRPGYSLFFVFLPEGTDPDDMVRAAGAEAMRARLDAARPLAEILWAMECAREPTDTPERRAGLEQRLRSLMATISDACVRAAYEKDMKERLFAFDRKRRPAWKGHTGDSRAFSPPAIPSGPNRCAGLALLVRAIDCPLLLDQGVEKIAAASFENRNTARVRDTMLSLYEAGKEIHRAAVIARLREIGARRVVELLRSCPPSAPAEEDAGHAWRTAMEEYCASQSLAREKARTRDGFAKALTISEQNAEWSNRRNLVVETRRSRIRANFPSDD